MRIFYFLQILFLIALFSCQPKNDHGFLRVDDNGRYFVFDDGTPYIPIGFNKFIFYEDDEQAIDSLVTLWSGHGVNYLRIWLGGGSDPEFPVGTFNETRMKKIDYIINKCKEHEIYLTVCFWNDNTLRYDVGYGWNNERMGYNKAIDSLGTTSDPEDLRGIEHLPSFNAVKTRFKVFVDRWNHHKNILMWDLVNDSKKTDEWKTVMYNYVRSLDPNNHIIGFQYNTGKDPGGEMDCGSVRVYEYNPGGNDPELMANALFKRVLEALQHGDPVYCGEGRMHNGEAAEYEIERFFLHTLWGSIAIGSAGNLHAWICPSKEGRWPDHTLQELKWMKGYSEFCKTINWSSFNSKNLNHLVSADNENVLSYACGDENEMLLYFIHDDPEDQFNSIQTEITIAAELAKASYKLDWIDVRSAKIVKTESIKSFPVNVEAPPFRDGIFAHLKSNI